MGARHSATEFGLSERYHEMLVEMIRQLADAKAEEEGRQLSVLILHAGVDGFTTNSGTWPQLLDMFENVRFSITSLCLPIFATYYPSVFTKRSPGAWAHHTVSDLAEALEPSALLSFPLVLLEPKSVRWLHLLKECHRNRRDSAKSAIPGFSKRVTYLLTAK